MDPITIGTLLASGGQAAGGFASLGSALGLFGDRNAFAREQLRAQQQNAFDNLQFQRDAANFGIRWKVADAEAAGIHPLYALGAPTFSPSPTTISGVSEGYTPDIGSGISQMGQGIGRAVAATQTNKERELSAAEQVLQQQAVERGGLQNDLLRAQIASLNARTVAGGQVGPGFPAVSNETGGLSGQGDFKIKPAEPVSQSPGSPATQAGPSTPEIQWVRSRDGVFARPTDQNMDQSLLNPEYLRFLVKNRLLGHVKPSNYVLEREFPGALRWNFRNGEFRPAGGVYPYEWESSSGRSRR